MEGNCLGTACQLPHGPGFGYSPSYQVHFHASRTELQSMVISPTGNYFLSSTQLISELHLFWLMWEKRCMHGKDALLFL